MKKMLRLFTYAVLTIVSVLVGVHTAHAQGFVSPSLGVTLANASGEGRADFGKGSPANPMSYDEVAAKFLDCAAFAKWSEKKAHAIVSLVGKLEDARDVRALTALCR